MITQIKDKIKTLVLFQNGSFKPVRFCWQNRNFSVDHITTSYKAKQGNNFLHVFAATCQGNTYKLVYNPQDFTWVLDEIYVEG